MAISCRSGWVAIPWLGYHGKDTTGVEYNIWNIHAPREFAQEQGSKLETRIPESTLRPFGVSSGNPQSPDAIRIRSFSDGARGSRKDVKSANPTSLLNFALRIWSRRSGAIIFPWKLKGESCAPAIPIETDRTSGGIQSVGRRVKTDAFATCARYCANFTPPSGIDIPEGVSYPPASGAAAAR